MSAASADVAGAGCEGGGGERGEEGPRETGKPGAESLGVRSELSLPRDPDTPSPRPQRSPRLSRPALGGEGLGVVGPSPLRDLRGPRAGACGPPHPRAGGPPIPPRGRADRTDDSTDRGAGREVGQAWAGAAGEQGGVRDSGRLEGGAETPHALPAPIREASGSPPNFLECSLAFLYHLRRLVLDPHTEASGGHSGAQTYNSLGLGFQKHKSIPGLYIRGGGAQFNIPNTKFGALG